MNDSERLDAIFTEMHALREKLDRQAEDLARFSEVMEAKRFSIEDLADRWGVSVSTLEHSPWKLPNYGRADMIGAKGRRYWLMRSVRALEMRPEDERLAEWDGMGSAERRRAMGRTA